MEIYVIYNESIHGNYSYNDVCAAYKTIEEARTWIKSAAKNFIAEIDKGKFPEFIDCHYIEDDQLWEVLIQSNDKNYYEAWKIYKLNLE